VNKAEDMWGVVFFMWMCVRVFRKVLMRMLL